jgi:hypothetical protein
VQNEVEVSQQEAKDLALAPPIGEKAEGFSIYDTKKL